MYALVKKLIKSFVSDNFLFRHEFTLRRLIALRYRGKNHQCSICNTNLKQFVVLQSHDLLCPACGSLSRTRRLHQLLFELGVLKGNVLHFSPSRSLYRNFKKMPVMNYFSSDFEGEFMADYHFDITKIETKDNFFDTIICYHILEHIENDQKAMGELFRVLKPTGICLIQTPFKDGDIYENPHITSKIDRLKHFGQSDHVRVYSVEGLKGRLENAGFKVTLKAYEKQSEDIYFGFSSPETILMATK